MTVAILGQLSLNRRPLKGQLVDAVHGFTLDSSVTEVSEVEIQLIDAGLHIWGSNSLQRGTEISWSIYGATRPMIIAVTEISDMDDVELVTLRCRPAAIEQLRNARGAHTWFGQSPTQWLATECEYLASTTHTAINFVGQPTMTRTQIVRRAEKGKVPESSWDVAGALASEEGFWLFEHAGTVYFGAPSWFATELAGTERDEWIWPRPASGKTPLLKVPACRVSDYADKANLQPATIDGVVAMDYALTLRPGQTIRVEIPGFRGRYLVTKITIDAGEPTATVSLESPVDPAPHTNLVTIDAKTVAGFDPATTTLTDVQIGAYFYNGMIANGFTPTLDNVTTFVAIAIRESHGVVTTHNPVPPDDSWGLWQINVLGGIHGNVRDAWEATTHTKLNWPEDLTDPAVNAFGAALLSGGGVNVQPWRPTSTFQQYLPRAREAATAVFALPKTGATVQIPLSETVPKEAVSAQVEQFVQFAIAAIGDQYEIGAIGQNNEFDCSGLVYAGLRSVGVTTVPRTALEQWQWCNANHSEIALHAAAKIRGALLFNVNHPVSGTTGHVVISLGDGIHTVEAKGEKWGVVEGVIGNRFDHAALAPQLQYPGWIYPVILANP